MKWMIRSVVLLAFGTTLAAALPEAWQNWRYSAAIEASALTAGQLVSVTIPASVTALSREDWVDLRVIDAGGQEVPFVLHARIGGRSVERRSLPLFDPSAVAGSYQQAIVDTGERGNVHNSVQLGFETDRNLLSWVEIAVSSDLADWRVVRERAPIYVLRAEGMGERTDVSYPDSPSRYVRIRVLDGSGTYSLESVALGYETTSIAERVPSGVALTPSAGRAGESFWTSEVVTPGLPLSGVEFETTETSFYRSATVESSDGGDRWQHVASGEILRVPDGAGERAWLSLDFPEVRARRWRITVDNRNDGPLKDLTPRLLTAPRRVVLRQESGASYRLLFGNPRADAPGYNMTRLTDAAALESAVAVTLGAGEENPGWVDPSPWTERYDAVLWVALVLAVLILAFVAVRTLRASAH